MSILSISTAPPTRRTLSNTAVNKPRYIAFSVETAPGNYARSTPGGVNISNLLSQRRAPSLGIPRLRLTPNFNVFGSYRRGGVSTSTGGLNVSATINGRKIGIPTNARGVVGAIASAYGAPTTMGGAIAFATRKLDSALPPLNEALATFGIPTNIRVIVGDLGLEFPKIPDFPGLDKIGLYLGAGKKWIAEQLAKYTMICPPFIPGLKINMGMALAALSIIRALMKNSPSEILKHLLSQIADDIVGQVMDQVNDAVDKTGINEKIGDLKDQIGGVLGAAQGQFELNFKISNPPRTETDEEGNVTEIAPEIPKSGIPTLGDAFPSGTSELQAKMEINQSEFISQNSQQKTYTFPPTG